MRVLRGYNGQRILVSPEDYELLATRRWSTTTKYAKGMWWGKSVPMHRIVLENKLGRELFATEIVDHINGDGFDNRRENLRVATPQHNTWNMRPRRSDGTGFVGVRKVKATGRFISSIRHEERLMYLGTYGSVEEAAYIRDQFAIALRGDFAYLNVLGE
jgi:hypothetical protein